MGSGKYLAVIIIVLIASTTLFAYKYFESRTLALSLQKSADTKLLNSKVVDFAGLFVDKVLKAEKEVSFDDRLQLENAVRDLKDSDILAAWNAFVASKSQEEAQSAVKNLLSILVHKIRAAQ